MTDADADKLLKGERDVLGEQVLGGGSDPSFGACASLLPELVGYTFLSNETSSEVIYVAPDGRLGVPAAEAGPAQLDQVLFNPGELLPEVRPTRSVRRLIRGYLPGIDFKFFDGANGVAWQQIAFLSPIRPELCVAFKVVRAGQGEAWLRLRFGAEGQAPVTIEWFSERLGELEEHWRQALTGSLWIDVHEAKIINAAVGSLLRALVTHDSAGPRYGMGLYRDPKHNHFPPATLSTVNACIEWGLLDRARAHLDYYLDKAVRPDGTFDYYGPAVSEYGQMLDTVARYARRSRDAEWLHERVPIIERIVGHLLRLRESGLKWPRDDPHYGLLYGAAEADTCDQADYYYAGSLWAWRGWLELARAYDALGGEALRARAMDLRAACRALRADTYASIERTVVRTTDPPFVPPVARPVAPFPTMTADRFASYTNYRYWPEMLSAGCLRPEWHDAIIAYRTAHGGELLGTTRFLDRLDDWPYAAYAQGLLLRDHVRHFLLGFYGDLAVHRMPGVFMPYEQVAIEGAASRGPLADYCVPGDLVAALLTRWMLAFEDPDAEVLWLCRATPRPWLATGERIRVKRATTRWGLVSFNAQAGSGGAVTTRVTLPETGFPAELRLRLRRPGAQPLRSVTVNGHAHPHFDPQSETIRIIRPEGAQLDIVAQ